MELSDIKLELDNGLLRIYARGTLAGELRVEEPAPPPFEAPMEHQIRDEGLFVFPNGWSLRNGIMYDENGNIIHDPPRDPYTEDPDAPIAFAGGE